MTPQDVILNTLNQADGILAAYLTDLSDADILVRPVPGMNHIAWQLGHLIASTRQMLEIAAPGSCPALPAGFAEAHGKEAAASDDPRHFLGVEQYKALWKAQGEAVRKAIAAVPAAELDRGGEGLPPYAPNVGAMLNMLGVHTLMHMGQFVAVRRLLGKPVTI